jgi:hypothetical protein
MFQPNFKKLTKIFKQILFKPKIYNIRDQFKIISGAFFHFLLQSIPENNDI